MSLRPTLLVIPLLALLAGCELLGIPSAEKVAAQREAEGKAIGGACRHAGRAIEDCYTLNRRADKAAVFAGWREMNDYMVENKLDVVKPTLPRPGAPRAADAASGAAGDDVAEAPARKGGKGS